MKLFACLVLFVLVAAACGGDDTDPTAQPDDATVADDLSAPDQDGDTAAGDGEDQPEATSVPDPTSTPSALPVLTLSLPDLPALGDGGDYEAWLIVDGEAVSAGTFDLDDGPDVELTLDEQQPATAVVVTIETDDDPAPSSTAVLAGRFEGGSATLTVTAPRALGLDFADASGQYILATPTDGDGSPENERSGIWWTSIPRDRSLVLPDLPEGWIYEGWQIIDGIAVTTGKFTSTFGEPDLAAPFSGPQPGPPFPGEDFLTNAPDGLTFPRDLRGTEVVITVEPFPDTGPEPFALIPLRGTVPDDAVDHTHLSVTNVAAELPTGTAALG